MTLHATRRPAALDCNPRGCICNKHIFSQLLLTFLLLSPHHTSQRLLHQETDLFDDIQATRASSNKDDCPADFFADVIRDQLSPWAENGIQESDLTGVNQFKEMGLTELGIVKIVKNKVYLKVVAYKYRLMRFTAFVFAALACRHDLPDVQFDYEVSGHIYNSNSSLKGRPPPPVFAYNRHRVHNPDLLLIPYQLATQNRHQLERDFILDGEMGIWDRRLPKAFWRGSTTGGPVTQSSVWELQRTKMVVACRDIEHLCDAKFSRVVQARNDSHRITRILDMAGLMGKVIPSGDVLRYKYVLLPDGNVAPTSRSIDYFRSASVVLKSITPFEEFWYPKLIPFYHYLPLPLSSQELNTTLSWLLENDDFARKVGQNSRAFAMKNLTVKALECYVLRLLEGYAKLLKFAPSVDEANMDGFVPIEELVSRNLAEQINTAVGYQCFDVNKALPDDLPMFRIEHKYYAGAYGKGKR